MTLKMEKALDKALLDACAEGDLPKVKRLLAQGCTPNGKDLKKDRHNSPQNSQVQPMHPGPCGPVMPPQ